ncbi:AbiJ-NTD4 domain-containing protein [Nocardia fluminea]|uniref:AbiJ-NTD4 domain-containing protein n=1 Tax=Nocardia fluminea TaxID=134984 RepID=UPI0037B7A93C
MSVESDQMSEIDRFSTSAGLVAESGLNGIDGNDFDVGPVRDDRGMRFSERLGLVPVRSVVQIESMDDELRTQLWNMTYAYYFEQRIRVMGEDFREFQRVWVRLMGMDLDHFSGQRMPERIKAWIKNGEWYQVYDLLEELVAIKRPGVSKDTAVKNFNAVLEHYLAGYRLIGGKVAPISDSHELSEIEGALTVERDAVRHHLQNALAHLANRDKPDYPNSIKESISAVEAFLAPITNEQTLGAAVKKLKKIGSFDHPALLDAWSKFYGWTSDENGIRHGGDEVPSELITQALARYVLISCSAFINLLIAEQAAGRIPLGDNDN